MQYAPLSDDSPNSSESDIATSAKSLSSSSCYSDEPTRMTPNGSSSIPMIKKITTNIKGQSQNKSLSEPLRSADDDDNNNDLLLYENGNMKDVEMGSSTTTTMEDDIIDDDDPFYVFKEDLTQKLKIMENNSQRYLSIVQSTDTAMNNHQVKDEKKALKKSIKNVESSLKDLKMTISVVEKNRNEFIHIDNVELTQRKVFIQHVSDSVQYAKKEMQSDRIKSKIVQDERALTLRKLGGNSNNKNNNTSTSETDDFLLNNVTSARLMLQEQDDTLEELDEAVIRVGNIADNIHEEVTFQNKMLSDLDDDLVDAEEKLGLVMGKLGKLLKTKSRWQICTILLLILVVLVLFFLILYT